MEQAHQLQLPLSDTDDDDLSTKEVDGEVGDNLIPNAQEVAATRAGGEAENENETEQTTATQTEYAKQNMSLKSLVVLCSGLKDQDGSPLMDINLPPWNRIARKNIKPNQAELRYEINRRFTQFGCTGPKPKPKHWRNEQILGWLEEHPISDPADVCFLKETMEKQRQLQIQSFDARQQEQEALELNWTGIYPFLRLTHCVIENTIKQAYLHRYDIDSSRTTVDNRNSDTARNKTVWEMIAELWNNPDFAPETSVLVVHPDFYESHKIEHELVRGMSIATAKKVKEKLASMNVALCRIISNWEQSGQGDGGFINEGEEDDENSRDPLSKTFGSLFERTELALSSRANFCQMRQSYLLYHWEMMDTHDLLRSSLQKINERTASVDGSTVPSVIQTTSSRSSFQRQQRMGKEQPNSMDRLSTSIETLGTQYNHIAVLETRHKEKERLLHTLEAKRDEKRKYRRLEAETRFSDQPNMQLANFYGSEAEAIQQEADNIEEELKKIESTFNTPQRNNRTPSSF